MCARGHSFASRSCGDSAYLRNTQQLLTNAHAAVQSLLWPSTQRTDEPLTSFELDNSRVANGFPGVRTTYKTSRVYSKMFYGTTS